MQTIGVDRVFDFGAAKARVAAAQRPQTAKERQQAENRAAARKDPDFDVTQHFGHLLERFGIQGFGLG